MVTPWRAHTASPVPSQAFVPAVAPANAFGTNPDQVQIGSRVDHRGVERGVPEPLTNRGEVNTGLEQMHGRGVAQCVRMDPATAQGSDAGGTLPDPLFWDRIDAKSS